MGTFVDWWKNNTGLFKAVLFDIDGTLISAGKVLPGAEELLALLRKEQFPFYLLTNDGNHSTLEKSQLMEKAGLHVSPEEIISCSMALEQFITDCSCPGETFFVMGDLGKPCYAEKVGLKVCRNISRLNECYGVIVGEGVYDWHENINAVLNYFVKNPDCPFVVPNPDSYWPGKVRGEYGIGAGAKARFICGILEEMGIKVEPVYLGKPYPVIYEYALNMMNKKLKNESISGSEIIMLGDSLKSDIKGANMVGMTSGLVLSGITSEKQAGEAVGDLSPDLVFSALG